MTEGGLRIREPAWADQAPGRPTSASAGPPRSVVLVVYDGAELVDIACVTSALDLATRLAPGPGYAVRLAAVDGTTVTCTSGLTLGVGVRLGDIRDHPDTLLITGGWGHLEASRNGRLVGEVRRLAGLSSRVVSVCTGAFVLAAAGLLDGRRATTHWHYAADLAARFPAVLVDADPIYVREGRIATSGGVTASLDLTLALIEEDHGAEIARRVAMGMVAYLHRPGNQAQMSIFTATPRSDDTILAMIIDHIVAHPDGDLSVPTLAARANVSQRHLTRLFQQHRGETPAAVVRRIRVELAARLLATTDLSLAAVARRCGFSSAETLRQVFVSRYETSPREFRRWVRSPGAGSPPAGDQHRDAGRERETADAQA
ncbi:MAG TPA: GlxA family transcriptional regulator [Microlunatus sp.]|nr:GlxA family transcriptional regulator [Microlunatus sp.]